LGAVTSKNQKGIARIFKNGQEFRRRKPRSYEHHAIQGVFSAPCEISSVSCAYPVRISQSIYGLGAKEL
jgi:hypothetical protein